MFKQMLLGAVMLVSGGLVGQEYIGAEGPKWTDSGVKLRGAYATGLVMPKSLERRSVGPRSDLYSGPLPAKFSWKDQAGEVRDQGNCGSCWAFAMSGVVEAAFNIVHGETFDASEQWLVDCDERAFGCSGGWLDFHMYEIGQYPAGGAVYEAERPYRGRDQSCPRGLHNKEAIVSHEMLSFEPADPDTLKRTIYTYGPIAVAVAADNDFMRYAAGVFNKVRCGEINHAVILVGWDDTTVPASWVMKNSWSENWGDGGYMNIAYGSCEIGTAATYVDIGDSPMPDPTPGPTPTPEPDPGGDSCLSFNLIGWVLSGALFATVLVIRRRKR